MWLMMQRPEPDDFVVATGETHSVREFVEKAFACIGERIVYIFHLPFKLLPIPCLVW